jgi:predicted HTH transcriptional regulator
MSLTESNTIGEVIFDAVAKRGAKSTLGITRRALEKQIAKLREEGRIRRIGPAKGGHWEVIK